MISDSYVQCANNLNKLHALLNPLDEQITDSELKSCIEAIQASSISVFEEYSKVGKIDDLGCLIARIRSEFKDVRELFNRSKKTDGAFQLVFSQDTNPKELKKELLFNLDEVEGRIRDLEAHHMVVRHFARNSSIPEKFSYLMEKFLEFFFSFATEKIRLKIFHGYSPKQYTLINNRQLKKLDAQITKVDAAINKLEAELAIDPNSAKVNAKKANLEGKKEVLKQKKLSIEERNSALQKKIETNKKKSLETRQLLHTLGGESVKLHNKTEDVTLDAFYISCDDFRKTLKDANAAKFEALLKTRDDQEISLSGLAFLKSDLDQELMTKLDTLGLFNGKEGFGFYKVFYKDSVENKTYALLVTEEKFQKLKKLELVDAANNIIAQTGDGYLNSALNWVGMGEAPYKNLEKFELEEWDLSQTKNGGTVLLTSGNAGVYEMHKYEMLPFLLNGMNVMALNFRGYGESTGYPTANGFKRDMETAYQYLKNEKGLEDNQLLLKALCVSGGAAADLASRHPDVNLLLDQTYSEFDLVVEETVKNAIKAFVDEYGKKNPDDESPKNNKQRIDVLINWADKNKSIISYVVSKLVSPNWSVKRHIDKVRGHIGLIHSTEDTLMKFDQHVFQNYQQAMKHNKNVTYMEVVGEHAVSWEDAPRNDFEIRFQDQEKIIELSKNKRKNYTFLANFEPFESVKAENLEEMIKNVHRNYQIEEATLRILQSTFIDHLRAGLEELSESRGVSEAEVKAYADDFLASVMLSEPQRDAVSDFLFNSITRKDILISFYNEVKDWYEREPSFFESMRDLNTLNHHINKKLRNLPYPEAVKGEISTFMGQALPNVFALWIDDSLPKISHKAGVQIIHFLNKAGLSAPLD